MTLGAPLLALILGCVLDFIGVAWLVVSLTGGKGASMMPPLLCIVVGGSCMALGTLGIKLTRRGR
jgi:hypothetical protein